MHGLEMVLILHQIAFGIINDIDCVNLMPDMEIQENSTTKYYGRFGIYLKIIRQHECHIDNIAVIMIWHTLQVFHHLQ